MPSFSHTSAARGSGVSQGVWAAAGLVAASYFFCLSGGMRSSVLVWAVCWTVLQRSELGYLSGSSSAASELMSSTLGRLAILQTGFQMQLVCKLKGLGWG